MFCFGSFQLSLWRPSSQGLFIKDALIQAACGLYACQVVHTVPSLQQLLPSLCSLLPSSAQCLGCPLHLCLPAPSLPPAGSVFQHRRNLLDPQLVWEGENCVAAAAAAVVAANYMRIQIIRALVSERYSLSKMCTMHKQYGNDSSPAWHCWVRLFGPFPARAGMGCAGRWAQQGWRLWTDSSPACTSACPAGPMHGHSTRSSWCKLLRAGNVSFTYPWSIM